ncbi:hypothetical protein VCR31J2_1770001 [Vibrio coralliirubri]|uniref:Uncharacterized protein n=1 Tax=Vibrio coralliirubri TaxID=1516159 RepID=A0AA87C215_9VIBR|nr:hypothetical protein VCR6J2_220103 [Vibrio coralliirubri]CDT41756.1 hypothetical protein VCR26J2_150223 [Vibrio coralliirubri]CDT87418.1 hypothetical protein VCR8J2_250137 [Vibrio coralliirubri]CDT91954.1 hypothetical protein VCR31J2_1770001 [Vibrio coralliirubri]
MGHTEKFTIIILPDSAMHLVLGPSPAVALNGKNMNIDDSNSSFFISTLL